MIIYIIIMIIMNSRSISINGNIVNKDITALDLNYNQLIKLPVEIRQLTNLTILCLKHNCLTHFLLDIEQLAQLTELYLSFNKLTKLPVEIGHCTQLTILLLDNNQLTHLPVEIGQLTQLTKCMVIKKKSSTQKKIIKKSTPKPKNHIFMLQMEWRDFFVVRKILIKKLRCII